MPFLSVGGPFIAGYLLRARGAAEVYLSSYKRRFCIQHFVQATKKLKQNVDCRPHNRSKNLPVH